VVTCGGHGSCGFDIDWGMVFPDYQSGVEIGDE
jgi:hypothetical protein